MSKVKALICQCWDKIHYNYRCLRQPKVYCFTCKEAICLVCRDTHHLAHEIQELSE